MRRAIAAQLLRTPWQATGLGVWIYHRRMRCVIRRQDHAISPPTVVASDHFFLVGSGGIVSTPAPELAVTDPGMAWLSGRAQLAIIVVPTF